jgi:hypothetical protein
MAASANASRESLSPQSFLAVQMLELLHRCDALAGERLLAFRVLKGALNRYLGGADSDARRAALFRDAEDWINRKGERSFFSFEHVCKVLDIEPGYLRGALRQRRTYNGPPLFSDSDRARRPS